MADDVSIRIRIRDAARAVRDARSVQGALRGIGTTGASAGRAAGDGMGYLAYRTRIAGAAAGYAAFRFTKMGLQFNANMEGARLRMGLFTEDAAQAQGVMDDVMALDRRSPFNLDELADATAYLGTAGVQLKDLDQTMQGLANAAAATGRGNEGLKRMAFALGQVQTKGRFYREEAQQFAEQGIAVEQILRKELGLTTGQMKKRMEDGIDGAKAVEILTRAFTSGKYANAAEAYTRTLGGQWSMLTGNVQRLSGVMTKDLADTLRRDILPAASEVSEAIERIFADDNLSGEEKARQARDLVLSFAREFESEFDLSGHLSRAVEEGTPAMMNAAGSAAPKVVGAFVQGWLDAGAWGKLITAAFLLSKMGAFTAVGGIVARRFATSFASTASTQVPAQLNARRGVMRPGLLRLGGWIGAAISAGIAIDAGLDRLEAAGGDPRALGREDAQRDGPNAFNLPGQTYAERRWGDPRRVRNPRPSLSPQQGAAIRGAGASSMKVSVNVDGREIARADARARARRKARR